MEIASFLETDRAAATTMRPNDRRSPETSCRADGPSAPPGRRQVAGALLCLTLICSSALAGTLTVADALTLQAAASARLKALGEEYRRDGDAAALQERLRTIDGELTPSNAALRTAGDDAHLATGLVKQADVWRRLNQMARAVALYTEALEAAQRAGQPRLQADAVSGRARAQWGGGQPDEAARDATRAVALARATGNQDALCDALGVLTDVHIQRQDFATADVFSKQELQAAEGVSDRAFAYLAHLRRAIIRMATLRRCDFNGDVVPCFEMMDAVQADHQAMRRLALSQGYAALAKTASDMLESDAKMRKTLEDRGH